MNKRKIALLAMSACMIAILAIGGTLAYFQDTDSAKNVFTFGNVQIVQVEQQRVLGEEKDTADTDLTDVKTGDGLETFEDDKVVYPAILNKLPKSDITTQGDYTFGIRSLEGNYVDKIVNVYNKGSMPAYMRTIIAVPSINGFDDDFDASDNPLHWNYLDSTDFEGIGWDWNGNKDADTARQEDKVAAVEIEGVEYDLYIATHNKAVAAKSWTSPSMVGFYLHDTVDYDNTDDEDGTGYFFIDKNGKKWNLSEWFKEAEDGTVTMNILVATQACQTEGFADAWEALDTVFGDITEDNHPWAE